MEKIVRRAVSYRCSVCGTEYRKKIDAMDCETMGIEEQKFNVGDGVTSLEPRVCSDDAEYVAQGTVRAVSGPCPPDEEYWVKWLGGLPPRHVFLYEVKYKCPICGQIKGAVYFAPELKSKIKK